MNFIAGFVDELIKLSGDLKQSLEAKYNKKLLGNWTDKELRVLDGILAKLPDAFVYSNANLLSIGRAPKILDAPSYAPGHSMYKPNHPKHGKYRGALVIFDKGVYNSNGSIDTDAFAKSILHELLHSMNLEPPAVFGKAPYITGYSSRDPKEDFAESFAEYFLHRDLLSQKAPEKAKAIAKLLEESK